LVDLQFTEKDPAKGYLTNQLLIPKGVINRRAVKESLTFYIGEEEVLDPDFGSLGMKPKVVHLWDETKHHMVVPRAYLDKKTRDRFTELHGVEWVKERLESKQIKVPNAIQARNSTQENAIRAMFEHQGGTVSLGCGMGKTAIALRYWSLIGRPGLVVVNSAALADQWMRKIRFFFGDSIKIGHIQGPNNTWRDYPIVVSTVQTLANRRDDWTMDFRRYFGVVFFDEGHHMAAPHFVKAADLFFGQRFSLTATAHRTDGLEAISMYHIGGIIYQDLEQDLIPDTIFHSMSWKAEEEQNNEARDKSGKVHHRKFCIMLGGISWRNQIILSRLRQDMEENRQILVLTHSVEHTRILGGLAQQLWKTAGIVNGKDVAPFDRIPILEKANPVIGTFDLAREALDKDVLDTLHICTPFGNSNDLQQSWGRIQRRKAGKNDARVRVYEDLIQLQDVSKGKKLRRINMSADQCRLLRTYLKALKYPFRNIKEVTPWK